MILFPDQIEAVFGEISGTNPLFILAVWTPGIAGAYLVWRHYGIKGLRSYLRRVTLWRMPGKWWLFLILGMAAVKYAGAASNGTIGDFSFSPGMTCCQPWPLPCRVRSRLRHHRRPR